jgi:hypothetical protein
MSAVSLDLPLTEPQERFVFSEAKYPAFVGGFGSGKTEALVDRSLLGKLRYPTLDRGFFAPTHDLIRLIAWPRFQSKLDEWGIGYQLNKSEGTLKLATGGQIIFRTMEAPERIVGFEIADADVDELDTLKPKHAEDAWNKIIARCRQNKPDGKPNTAGVGTTPEGFRFTHDRWVKRGGEQYELITAPTHSNPTLPGDYVEGLRATYPPQLLEAYIEGRFVNLTAGSVYPLFDRTLNGTDELILPKEALHIGMDFNVGQMTAKVSVIRGDDPYTLDELTGVLDTPSMIEALREKYVRDGRKADQITIYPDAAGGSRDTRNASSSDLALLRNAGFRVLAPPSNPPIRDRVVSVNAMVCNGKGERRWKVNPKTCPRLVQDMEQQAYDANGMPDKSAGNDHGPDALGYFMHSKFPAIRTSRPKVDKSVPQGVKPFSVEWMTHGTQS